jgi:transposase
MGERKDHPMKPGSSGGASRRGKYTEQYRNDAVELWRASGRTAKEIATQLGIKTARLYVWAGEYRPPGGEGAGAPLSPEQLARENAALREEVERLREQRDILKKSLGILSEPPLRGLPRSKP